MYGKVTAQFSLRGGMSNLVEKCSNSSQARMRSSTKKCDPRGGHYVGKNDLRHAGIGYRDDEPAAHGKCGALLALVFPIWRGHELRSRLRVRELGAVHGHGARHRRLLLCQSVPSAGARPVRKAASPNGARLKRSARPSTAVTRWLDPRVHPLRIGFAKVMDARVKPAHDDKVDQIDRNPL